MRDARTLVGVSGATLASLLVVACSLFADVGELAGGQSTDVVGSVETPPEAGAEAAPEGDAGAGDDAETGADANVDGGCFGVCPVAAYDFDEGSGIAARDTSSNHNDCALSGSATWGIGKIGAAASFAGAGSAVQCPLSPSLDIAGTHLTLAFWAFVVDDQTHDHAILDKPWTSGAMNPPYYQYGVEFQRVTKTYAFHLGFVDGAQPALLRISALPTGTWTHVAFTYDGALMKGYINGVLLGQLAETTPIVARGTAFRMGADGAGVQGLSGRLDAVRIYDQALTVGEIVALRDGL